MPTTCRANPLARLATTALLGMLILWAPTSSLVAEEPGDEPAEIYEKPLEYMMAFPEYEDVVPERDDLMAVPVSLLEAHLAQDATSAPIPTEQLADFVAYANEVSARHDRKACRISPAASGWPPPVDPQNRGSVLDMIALQDIVLLGTIEHIAPTWNFHENLVTSLVFVRIEEVLRDETGSFSPGQLVTFIRWWGEATILEVPFCTKPPHRINADNVPGVGDRVVQIGMKDLRNPSHLVVSSVDTFPVIDEVVHKPEGSGLSDRTATLTEVRESLR